ncbi:MAG TPA: glycosyltransferase 87 family protein [Xanthobacteraceae bacterium]|nr:glycosyltransferase 87 family protein [Xanthobacteraceae bacterium]
MDTGAAQGKPERAALLALAAAGLALVALSPLALYFLFKTRFEGFVAVALVQGAVYAVAVFIVLRRRLGRAALAVVFIAAVAARAIALPAPALLSTDVARYVWDGRVQAAGINPYRYVPADPQLAGLRDKSIYPNINRADYAVTIYPPVAEMMFFLATRVSESFTMMRLTMIGFEAVTVLALLALLEHDGRPAARVLIYAWHPLPIWEFAGTGHVDAAAMALMTLAMLAAARERRVLAGIALAAGTLIKPFVLFIGPPLWRRWDWRLPAAFVATAIVCYLPYLSVGTGVLGYLGGGYQDEQGYLTGSGFFLVSLLRHLGLPAPGGVAFSAFAALVLIAIAVAIAFRKTNGAGPAIYLPLATAAVLLVSPHYAWYFAWLLPLITRAPYAPLIYVTLASFIFYLPPIMNFDDYFTAGLWLYGGAALLALADFAVRSRPLPVRRPA